MRIHFSLGRFLLVCIVAGCAIGLSTRAILFKPYFECKDRVINDFMTTSMWRKQFGEEDELLYLLVYPEGILHAAISETFSNR